MTEVAAEKIRLQSRASWYAWRLRAMTPVEVPLRAYRDLRARLDDAAWRLARPLWRRVWCPADSHLYTAVPALEHPLGFLGADRVTSLAHELPDAAAAVVDRADQTLAGRVRLLGYPEVQLSDPPDWSHDPISGRTWPEEHGKLLDYRSPEHGDPKWIWELNRCQDLPVLALAWRLSGEDRFADAVVGRMLSWIDRWPPGRGIAWSNGFEAGLRAISFALAYDCLRGSPVMRGNEAGSILRSLWQHARFILRDLSPGSSANNHLVGELAGLAAIGFLTPELRDADSFRERGLVGLARETERQILPDGTGAEQAFAYHLFVLDLVLLVAALAEARSAELPPAIPASLARAREAIGAQVQESEPDPAYGDADDGRAFVLDAAERRGAHAVCATIDACLGRSVARPDTAALLLFGPPHARDHEDTPPRNALLPDSGIVVLRRGRTRVLFDAGPLGYLSLAAHGHADALQVTLTDGDLEVVGDPGTGTYSGDRVRRAAFRGTAFHATVTVDGLDQAQQAGPFLWRRHYRARLRACDLEGGVVVAEHDGYARLADPVVHSRALLALDDGAVLVVDRLDAVGEHRYRQTWPLHPMLSARARGPLVEASDGEETRLAMWLAASPTAHVRLRRGEHQPLAGWWSRRLESSEPSWTVTQEAACAGGASLAALVVVGADRALHDPGLTLRVDGRTTHVSFAHAGTRHRVRLDTDDRAQPIRLESSPAVAGDGSTMLEANPRRRS